MVVLDEKGHILMNIIMVDMVVLKEQRFNAAWK